MSYKFTNNWFQGSSLQRRVLEFMNPDEKNTILEIGTHEGASACFFSDFLLNHPESTLTCVDPYDLSDQTSPLTNETYELYRYNISQSKNGNKVNLEKTFSYKFFQNLNYPKYNFIYIDGSHLLEDITIDFVNSLKVILPNGIIWMDDYLGADGIKIRKHIDSLYEANKDKLDIILKEYQIAFRYKQ